MFVGPSGGGKNRAVAAGKDLMPNDAVFEVTAASPKALIHLDQDLQHKVLVMSEADSIPDDGPAASAVRSLASEGMLAYDVSEQDPLTNRWQTRRIQRPGPTALITTSTALSAISWALECWKCISATIPHKRGRLWSRKHARPLGLRKSLWTLHRS